MTLIKRALLSVYDKTGIIELAAELRKQNIEIISTGGTYKLLKENNIEVKTVEEVTGFPEVLNGRVKTLHPKIFAGILGDRENKSHSEEIKKHNIEPVDLVVVNLYPFKKTISEKGVSVADAIEQIDIGGVTLIRAAAKNFKDVIILTDIDQYREFIEILISTKNNIPVSYSQKLAQTAFKTVSEYDNAIQKYFTGLNQQMKIN